MDARSSRLRVITWALLLTLLVFSACAARHPGSRAPAAPDCGQSPDDWCTTPAESPCGAHDDERSCRADPKCKGKPYAGESVVACHPDGCGFWDNCPAVGCVPR